MVFTNQILTFHSEAVPDDTFLVSRMVGEERMSGLFRFELDLVSIDPEVDLEAVLYAPVRLGIKVTMQLPGGLRGSSTREIGGVLAELEQHEVGQGWVRYRAVLVPKMWLLTRTSRSRVFMDKTVDEMVGAVLSDAGMQPDVDFSFDLGRPEGDPTPERAIYPLREYMVQYEESDYELLTRWLEHEGIYFSFKNDDGQQQVVFADTSGSYAPPPFSESYPYRPNAVGEGADADQSGDEEVHRFSCRQRRLPETVGLNDYNWRTPSAQLQCTADVREGGTGTQKEYNDHYKTVDQGNALAGVRKEELACRSRVFEGSSSCRGFQPGTIFGLEEHFRTDFNRNYLLIAVHHDAEQMLSLDTSTVTGVKYKNTFEAIPDDQMFRPERVTDWPSIKGVMHARIDAEGDGRYAEIDEHGRYKVRIPFDEYTAEGDEQAADGKASRWVRMAQPYAGADSGMHFPLLKGTEVLITHIDGDPDRPIIASAVPNPETQSPSNSRNPTRNSIRTNGGSLLQMDDDEAATGFRMMDGAAGLVQDIRRPRLGRPVRPAPAASSGSDAEAEAESNSDPSIFDSWEYFVTGPAIEEIQTARRYRTGGDDSSLGTASRSQIEDYLGQLLDVKNNSVYTAAFGAIQDSYSGFPFANQEASVDDFIRNEVNTLSAEAFGSRLRSWVGDDYMVRVGDNYTFADVSNDVKFGTGGFSFNYEAGDTFDVAKHDGNAVSHSTYQGGVRAETYNYSGNATFSFTVDATTSMDIRIAATETNSISLGAFNSVGLQLGEKGSVDIFGGYVGKVDVDMSGKLLLNVAVGVNIAMNLAAGANFTINVGDFTELNTSTRKAALKDFEANLMKTGVAVKSDDGVVLANDAAVKKASATLSTQEAILSEQRTALSEMQTAVSSNSTNLSRLHTSAQSSDTQAIKTLTSGFTNIA